MTEKFDIAGYCRISVDEELDRDNTSIENQKAIIRDYVKRTFPGSSLTFYEDRDRSGYTFEQREGYQEMRPLLMNNQYDILVVKDFSRFSRRNSRGLVELEDLRDKGVRIISIGDSIDYPTYDDWTAIQFRFLVNEMPVTDASKKVRSVIKRRQEDGAWLCALPYGYVFTNSKNKTFEIEPSEAEVIRKIYDLYIGGWGYKKIANYLTDQHIPTPRMSEKARREARGEEYKYKIKPEWSIVTVQGILENDFYIGTLRQGKYTRKGINGDSIRKAEDEQIVFEKNHEAIIDDRTFMIVKQAMQNRTSSHYRGVKKYDNVYSGFMECGDCGSPMFPMSRSQLKDAYRCGRYHQRGLRGCTSHHIKVETIDALLKMYLQNVRDTSAQMLEKLQENINKEEDDIKENKDAIEILEVQLADAKAEKKVLVRQCARELMRHPENEENINESYDELIAECDNRIAGLDNQIALTADKHNTIIRVNRIAKIAIDVFSSILDKKKFDKNDLDILIERIYVYEDNIHIKLKSDIECILKSGMLPEGEAVNFSEGIINSLSTEIVEVSKQHPDKVYDVNVIGNGDPLEIYTDADGEVIFKKYSPIGELSSITGQYADVLARGTGLAVIITDRDSVIACAGISKKEVLDRRVSQSLESLMERRENYVCCVDSERMNPIEGVDKEAAVAFSIVGGGDVSGSIVMLLNENGSCPTQTETKLAQIAASFLGKQMEE